MNRLHVTSPQPVSLIYCVLNINLSSTYMLLVTALNIPQAYKSKAVSWTAAQQNSTAFLHAQPCSSLALYWTAEGLSTAHCPRGDSWCTLSCSPVALTDLRTELTRHRKTQRALAHVAFADTQPWPCQLWVAKAQPPASMENIPFSDVFNTEGGATIIISLTAPRGSQQGPAQRCADRWQMWAGEAAWEAEIQNRDLEADAKDCW